MNDWPIWIADFDGDNFTMRELIPGSQEYRDAANALVSGFRRAVRKAWDASE